MRSQSQRGSTSVFVDIMLLIVVIFIALFLAKSSSRNAETATTYYPNQTSTFRGYTISAADKGAQPEGVHIGSAPTSSRGTGTTTSGSGSAVGHFVVTINDYGFSPREMTVPVGQPVTFVNAGKKNVRLLFERSLNVFGPIAPGSAFTVALPREAGTYTYRNADASSFRGSLIVSE